jgi:hypothetical protein
MHKPFDAVDLLTAINRTVHESPTNEPKQQRFGQAPDSANGRQGERMTGESKMIEVLPKAFWMALMLTGSIEAAEAVVLDAIATLELDHISGDSVLLATAKSSIQRRTDFLEQSGELSILPLELRRLFRLAPNYRDCFVLRVLIGLSPEFCSGILHLSIHEVEDALYTALQGLPRIEPFDMDRAEIVHPAQDAKVGSCTSPSAFPDLRRPR